MSTLFLLGFLLAILIGANSSAENEVELLGVVFLAVMFAATATVILQILQWLDIDLLGIWLMNTGRVRPSGNFGQPNQLATFQLWAIFGVGWWWSRQRLTARAAIVWVACLLIGVALTQSRTSWLNILIAFVAIWLSRGQSPNRRNQLLLIWCLFAVWFVVCLVAIEWCNTRVATTGIAPMAARMNESVRPLAWDMFLQAIWEKPYWGYGWDQTGQVHIAMALSTPKLLTHFAHAHNLILDILLWVGVPIGVGIIASIGWFLTSIFKKITNPSDFCVFACVLSVGTHSLLELPLHYAYFFVPLGFFLGVLTKRAALTNIISVHSAYIFCGLLAASTIYALVVRDYVEVDARFREMLHEKAHIGTNHPRLVPDVFLLNRLQATIVLARVEPVGGESAQMLEWARQVATASPSMGSILKLSLLYAKNQRPAEATQWLQRACNVMPVSDCAVLFGAWNELAKEDPALIGLFPNEAVPMLSIE